MAKSPLKRPAAKPASKKPSRVLAAARSKPAAPAVRAATAATSRLGARPAIAISAAGKPAAAKVLNGKPLNGRATLAKAAPAKEPAKPVAKEAAKRSAAATFSVKPALRAAAAAVTTKLDGANKLPINGRASIRAGVLKTTIDGKSASALAAKNVAEIPTNGSKPANGAKLTNGAKHTNGSKPANGSKAANGTPAIAPVEPPKVPGRPMLMQGPVASKALSKKGTFVLSKTPLVAPKPIKRKIERPEPAFVTLQPPVAQVRTSEKAVKNRAGLNQRDLDFFRDLLISKRRELVGDMSHMEREALRENNASVSSVPVDPTDQGTDAYEQEFTLGLVEKDRTLLREINDAMAKLQNGTYGICEGTGEPISRPRLEAQPWARHSIEFARILEKRKMMFRR